MTLEPLDHLCRMCGIGRLIRKPGPDGKPVVWCPNCEAETEGSHKSLCFCGHRFPSGARSYLVCVRNEAPTEDNPHVVVVKLDEQEIRRRKSVASPKKAEGPDLFEETVA